MKIIKYAVYVSITSRFYLIYLFGVCLLICVCVLVSVIFNYF